MISVYTAGAGINFCMIVPSLDLVAVRVGNAFKADWHQVFRDIVVRLFDAVDGRLARPSDDARPTVSVVSPKEGQTVSGEVEIHGTADDADEVACVTIDIDGCGEQWKAEGTRNWRYVWDTRPSKDGPRRIHVRAFDRAGNASEMADPIEVHVTNGPDSLARHCCG